ncbi:MAG: hypothetical protein CV082_03030 [Candidatus Brocadia sp. BL1]|nr:MAG: hypothetical protein CV082_03030 [Candidatus Brocadia sp. BL1]
MEFECIFRHTHQEAIRGTECSLTMKIGEGFWISYEKQRRDMHTISLSDPEHITIQNSSQLVILG